MWCTNRLLWHTNSDFYGIRTPTFTPYEPFLLGGGGGLQYIELLQAVRRILLVMHLQLQVGVLTALLGASKVMM